MKKTIQGLNDGVFGRRKGRPRAPSAEPPGRRVQAVGLGGRVVRLAEEAPRRPVTPVERLAVGWLAREGAMRFDLLAKQVAFQLYLDELGIGPWMLDLGLFGRDLFLPDVACELEAGDGILWTIGKPERAE